MSALAARVVGTANELVAGQPKTSYRISVTAGGDASTCLRSFGDFQALHESLAKLKLSSLPSLPGKFELGLERAEHLRAALRMDALDNYLQKLCALPAAGELAPLVAFLDSGGARERAASSVDEPPPAPAAAPALGPLRVADAVAALAAPAADADADAAVPRTLLCVALPSPAAAWRLHRLDPPPAAPQLLLPPAALAAHERGEPDVDDRRVLLLEPGGALLQCALGDHRPGARSSRGRCPRLRCCARCTPRRWRRSRWAAVTSSLSASAPARPRCSAGAAATKGSWATARARARRTRAPSPSSRARARVRSRAARATPTVIAGGAAYTCGAGDAGQLGLGDAKTQAYPRRVALGTGAARLLLAAGGGRHTLLVDARGAVHACGCGSSGQLGTGLAADEHKPVALASLGGQLVRDAAAGDAHSVLLTLDGAVLVVWRQRRRAARPRRPAAAPLAVPRSRASRRCASRRSPPPPTARLP